MKRRVAMAALALVLLESSPALAWDPFRERTEQPAAAEDPDPAPFVAPPPGVYYVTDTYVADVVASNGPLTTYSTITVHESTGSYARVLETVGTGAPSAYDGSAFNGRRSLADGRAVAGTYYQNYVLIDGDFVPVSIVFFQDDAELARILAERTPLPSALPVAAGPSSVAARPIATPCCPSPRAGPTPAPTHGPARPIQPGVSLLPVSAPLRSVEVLRGRAVALWLRAFVDGREMPVTSWTLLSGDPGDAVATSGSGAVPFRTAWLRLAPAGAAYDLLFRLDVDTPDGRRSAEATIAVAVRSPALED
jgi:hypothetical protein